MAKHHNKALSVLLASMMVASMCCVPTTVSAASTTKEESGSTLASYYSTNSAGFGANKTISVDGSLSDWDSSMLIAQGTANDDPRVYRPNSMYELGVDLYALYGAYDDNNVYLMWEMTNVQDVVAPNDNYPLSQGILWQTQEFPFFIAVDTGKSDTAIGNNGALTTGGTIWNSGMTFENSFNKLISINTKGGNGPWVYGGDSTGLSPVEILDASTSNIKMDYGLGILSKNVYGVNGAYGTNNGRVPGDVCSESSDWVDFNTLGHSSSTMDFFYELSIPYSELGITKSDVQNNGIGVMLVATMGKSAMDCLPGDVVMTDQADLDDAANSQENNSFEKSDEDFITASFASIGSKVDPTTPTATTPTSTTPTSTTPTATTPTSPTTPTTPSNVTGYEQVTVEAGDTVTFTVDATTSKKISNYLITTGYDADAFTLDTSYSSDGVSTLGSSSGMEQVNTTLTGKVKAAVLAPETSPYTATSGTTLQTIQLTAKKAGTFNITYIIEEMCDTDLNDLVTDYKPVSGVTVTSKATVNGEDPTDPTAPVDAETGSTTASFKAGDTVEYYVNMKFAKELYGFHTDITYNSSLLKLESIEYPNFDGTIESNTDTAGKISVIGAGSPTETFDFTSEKTLVKVTFTALADGTNSKISYLMKQTIGLDEIEQFDPTTGQPLTSDVSTSNSVNVLGEDPTEVATTASTEVTVKAGDKVNYWVEVAIPSDVLDVAGWTVDMYFDADVFDANMDFAGGYGFAAGTNAVNYALGLSDTSVDFPGGSLAQATIVDGRASITDANPNGLKFQGKTTKVVCIQLVAEKDATTTLSYRMRDLVDTNLENSYVNKETLQPAGGATYAQKAEVVSSTSTEKALYLKPNSNWLKSDARFAMYVTGENGSEWISMTDVSNGYYKAVVPSGYTTVTFARMNPATTENKVANRWNYSAEMTIPTDDTNCFTVDAGQWSSATGEWSVYVPEIKTLYLKPNANWIKSDARFAMYVTGEDGSEWVSMTAVEDGYYSAEVPEGTYTTVSFARMNPATTENKAANRWNYSADMTIPTDDTNCFTVDEGQWSSATGEWSIYVSKASLKKLYLKPNSNWIKSDARFAMYVTGENGSEWVSMEDAGDGCYTAYVPSNDYTTVTFARMNGLTTENTLVNRWNYSAEMTIPTDDTNCFAIDAGQWSSATGSWEVFTPTVYEVDALYLSPNKNWAASNARFAMYLYGGESDAVWVSMTKLESGSYKADIPAGDYAKVMFVRMNPNTTENVWANQWNASIEMDIPTNGTNRFVVGSDQWSSATGTMDSITELQTLYLTPNKNWVSSNARFAVYLYGGESAATWVSMTSLGNGTYKADIPEGHYTKVIFSRMKGSTTENVWSNSVNESLALRIPVKGTDAFTINDGQWSSASGVWSTYGG